MLLRLIFRESLISLELNNILGWPKSSFGFFYKMLQKNPNELFAQPNNFILLRLVKLKVTFRLYLKNFFAMKINNAYKIIGLIALEFISQKLCKY